MAQENQQAQDEAQEQEHEETEVESATETEDEAEPDKAAADEGKDRAQKKKGGNLQGALNEERTERKRLAEEVKKERAEREKIANDFTALQQKQDKFNKRMAEMFGGEEGGNEPTFEQNPAEYLRAKTEAVEKDNQQVKQFFEQQRALQQVTSFAQSDVARVKAENPDYDDAYNFLRGERVGEVMAIYECSEAEAAQRVNEEELNFVVGCARDKRSPAKALYAYAKKRGYKPASESGAARLNALQSGMAGSKSLSSAAGKATGTLTLDDIAGMSDEDFTAFKAKNPKRLRELMGSV